jgi:hypothetical protein
VVACFLSLLMTHTRLCRGLQAIRISDRPVCAVFETLPSWSGGLRVAQIMNGGPSLDGCVATGIWPWSCWPTVSSWCTVSPCLCLPMRSFPLRHAKLAAWRASPGIAVAVPGSRPLAAPDAADRAFPSQKKLTE